MSDTDDLRAPFPYFGGSGVAMYDHMLAKIERSRLPQPSLFAAEPSQLKD